MPGSAADEGGKLMSMFVAQRSSLWMPKGLPSNHQWPCTTDHSQVLIVSNFGLCLFVKLIYFVQFERQAESHSYILYDINGGSPSTFTKVVQVNLFYTEPVIL